VGGSPRYLACFANDVRPHFLRNADLVTLDSALKVKDVGVSAAAPRGLAVDGLQDLYLLSGDAAAKVDRYERVPGGLTLKDSVAAPAIPVGLAADAGEAWVAAAGGKVLRVRKADSSAVTFEGFGTPTGIGLGQTDAWVTSADARVYRIDRGTGAKTGEFVTGAGPIAVAIDPAGTAWVANAGSSSATRISAAGQVASIDLGAVPTAVLAGPRRIWFALPGKLACYRLDGSKEGETSLQVVDSEMPPYALNADVLALDADRRVWALDRARGEAMPVWGRKADE